MVVVWLHLMLKEEGIEEEGMSDGEKRIGRGAEGSERKKRKRQEEDEM